MPLSKTSLGVWLCSKNLKECKANNAYDLSGCACNTLFYVGQIAIPAEHDQIRCVDFSSDCRFGFYVEVVGASLVYDFHVTSEPLGNEDKIPSSWSDWRRRDAWDVTSGTTILFGLFR
jgi:hypothetical protein